MGIQTSERKLVKVGPSMFVVVTRTSEEKVMSRAVSVPTLVLRNFERMWVVRQGRGQEDESVPSIRWSMLILPYKRVLFHMYKDLDLAYPSYHQ